MRDLGLGGREDGLCGLLCSLESTRKTELGVDTLDTVGRVDVLDHGDLVASGGTLTGDDGGVGKEVFPDSEPALAVLGLDLLAVAHPVTVPAPESGTVVNTDSVNALDLETSALKLVDGPAERSRGVSTGEDVLVHE